MITKNNIQKYLPSDMYIITEIYGKPTFEMYCNDVNNGFVYEFLEDKMTLKQFKKHIDNLIKTKNNYLALRGW